MKLNFTAFIILAFSQGAISQALTEKTGLRFYEHHSSDMTNMPFGNGANGAQSGYDFVQGRYYYSYDSATMDRYQNGEEANLDMVEHNGVFGTGGNSRFVGFTSGVSTIWGGDIKGNGTTKWLKPHVSFSYQNADDMTDLSAVWNENNADVAVSEVKNNDIYIGKIRGGNQYVVIRCYNVQELTAAPGQNGNMYFDFDYKYVGTPTGIAEASNDVLAVYPNPANNELNITLGAGRQAQAVKIFSIVGEEVLSVNNTGNQVDLSMLTPGMYILNVTTTNGEVLQKRIIRE